MPFSKAKKEQRYIKIGMYGAQGSGKTVTALLFAEGLANREKKKIAYIDTEHGTDYYACAVAEREFHPEAFDFDASYTRSISECIKDINNLDINKYGVLILDSITHIWEAAINSYSGKKTGAGGIPLNAWGDIKRPYKDLINTLMNLECHVIICGREGMETENVEGELLVVGRKMKAEGETAYEPHILINMKQFRHADASKGVEKGQIVAYFEKDRTGLFTGKSVVEPNYKTIEPLTKLLSGNNQAKIQTESETSENDSQLIDDKKEAKREASKNMRLEYQSKIVNCKSLDKLIALWSEIPVKKMYKDDLDILINIKDEYKDKLSDREFENKEKK